MNNTFDEMDNVVDTFFTAIDRITESNEGTTMRSARERLLNLTQSQKATTTIAYVTCPDCGHTHTKVDVVLPEGYSWHSAIAGPFSGLGIMQECDQEVSDMMEQIHAVIDEPVLKDVVHVGSV